MESEWEAILGVHVQVPAAQAAEQSRVEMDEADHVESVVLERGLQKIDGAGAQEVEVRIRHQCARQWIVALVTKHSMLHESRRAALESMLVRGSPRRQQIGGRGVCELARLSCHAPGGAQDGQVERPAIERGEPI